MRLALVSIVTAGSLLGCGGDDSTSPGGSHLAFTVQPSNVKAGEVLSPAVQVSLEDAAGKLVPSSGPTITLGLESGATLSGTISRTASGGIAVFSDLTIAKSGTAKLVAVSPDAPGATSTAFTVLPLSATSIMPLDDAGQAAGVGSAVLPAPSVAANDVFGNPVPGVQVTFAVVSGGGTVQGDKPITGADGIATVGAWTLGNSPGPNTLQASSEGLAGSPVLFNATATPLATDVTIEVHNNYFLSLRNQSGGSSQPLSPAVDTIAVGGTVTWVWVGQNHNVTPLHPGEPSSNGTHDAPFTFGPITFSSPGVYYYRCTKHSHVTIGDIIGMAGRIVIR